MRLACEYVGTLWPKPGMEVETDFRIIRYRPLPGEEYTAEIIAKGEGLPEHNFFEIALEGKMVSDPQYGDTFLVSSFETAVKKTKANILGYLASGAVKGVGPAVAKRIVDHFGVEALDILEKDPSRLREVPGIGEKVLQEMVGSFEEHREINALMLYAVPVAGPSGGAYHVATGANTAIFAPAGTAYTPGGTSQMAAPSKPEGVTATDPPETAVSQAADQVEQIQTAPNGDTALDPPAAPQPDKPPTSPSGAETPPPVQPTETPPPVPKPEPPQNQVRRFSRNNPANVEIFRRGGGQVESFERTGPEQESGSHVLPPKKDKKG